ncbi:MAG: 50S ribosomal protein L14e [Candidatus Bathyarchaeota archaeon]|nr:50S ribosomal protein L14e [Candidatus Bathyarchaeota archaeon]
MSAVKVGRVCVKTRGRESGMKCVVVEIIDKSFVLITGPEKLTGVKRRRVNINHIRPLDWKIDIKKGVTDKFVVNALKKMGKIDEMTAKAK